MDIYRHLPTDMQRIIGKYHHNLMWNDVMKDLQETIKHRVLYTIRVVYVVKMMGCFFRNGLRFEYKPYPNVFIYMRDRDLPRPEYGFSKHVLDNIRTNANYYGDMMRAIELDGAELYSYIDWTI